MIRAFLAYKVSYIGRGAATTLQPGAKILQCCGRPGSAPTC